MFVCGSHSWAPGLLGVLQGGSRDPGTQMLGTSLLWADVWVLLTLMGHGRVSACVCVLFFCWHSWNTPVSSLSRSNGSLLGLNWLIFSWVKDHTCYFGMPLCADSSDKHHIHCYYLWWIMPWDLNQRAADHAASLIIRNVPYYRITFCCIPAWSGFSPYYKLANRNPEATAIFSFSLLCMYLCE